MVKIIDKTSNPVDFQEWLKSSPHYYDIKITDHLGGTFRAELLGTYFISGFITCDMLCTFEGYGDTKERAINNLRDNMSNQTHYPLAKKTFGGLFFKRGSKKCNFPVFE